MNIYVRTWVFSPKIGALVSNGEQAQLRFSLLRRCTTIGKQPWPNTPTIFALDRETGAVVTPVETKPMDSPG